MRRYGKKGKPGKEEEKRGEGGGGKDVTMIVKTGCHLDKRFSCARLRVKSNPILKSGKSVSKQIENVNN